MSHNPLAEYLRQPVLYVELPSGGQWWPDGSLHLSLNKELPVMSMTAGDEILLRTPEALLSGEATVRLIENCVPAIQNAWEMPIVDLESLLIAIRIASTGETMGMEITCPACQHPSNYDIDLKDQMNQPDLSLWNQPLSVQMFQIFFKPVSYKTQSEFHQKLFQCQKQLSQVKALEDPQQRDDINNAIVQQLNQLDIQFVANNIQAIQVKEQLVNSPEFIQEFIFNCDKRIYTQVRNRVEQLKKLTKNTELSLHCPECAHDYHTDFSLDYTSFFDLGF